MTQINSLSSVLEKDSFSGILIEYEFNNDSLLNRLCDKYGSDKGEVTPAGRVYTWPSHTYVDVYEMLFQSHREQFTKVLECGLGTNNPNVKSNMGLTGRPGASLRMWRDYFPNAQVIGIDIDGGCLFEEERIKTYQCDQSSRDSIQDFVLRSGIQPKEFDFILDDGLHAFEAGIPLFEEMISFLKNEGFYIIEDVHLGCMSKYKDYFQSRTDEFKVRYFHIHRPGLTIEDNRLVVISRRF